ncbi:MAG: hypothetical protein LLG00_06265, partial [Planctomycetaceae bacterium]|nr:hypothetical protein [Planctomycetaceae bacterium]
LPDDQCPNGDGSPGEHSHHGSEGCDEGHCSAVVQSQASSLSPVQLSQPLATPLLEDHFGLSGCFRLQRSTATGRLLLPVRLHLANQVLLI